MNDTDFQFNSLLIFISITIIQKSRKIQLSCIHITYMSKYPNIAIRLFVNCFLTSIVFFTITIFFLIKIRNLLAAHFSKVPVLLLSAVPSLQLSPPSRQPLLKSLPK